MAEMDTTSTLTRDILDKNPQEIIIEYVKEKDILKADLKEKEKEIQQYKAKVYDLTNKVDELKTQVKNLQKESSRQLPTNNSNSQVPANKLGVVRPTTSKSRTPVMKRAKSSKPKTKGNNGPKQAGSTSTPVQDNPEPISSIDMNTYQEALKSIDHFHEVATNYPDLKLSVMLSSEKFFRECDMNNDGTIDEEELEKLLIKQGHLYTNKELKEMMSQIDKDNDSAIDIMEYLAVMERVQQRKRVNLPTALTKSATCAVQ